jgi:hypothetical protein
MLKKAVLGAATAALAALSFSILFSIFATAQSPAYNPALWSGMKYRRIGPNRGGRVTAVIGVPSQPYQMGSTGGGDLPTPGAVA